LGGTIVANSEIYALIHKDENKPIEEFDAQIYRVVGENLKYFWYKKENNKYNKIDFSEFKSKDGHSPLLNLSNSGLLDKDHDPSKGDDTSNPEIYAFEIKSENPLPLVIDDAESGSYKFFRAYILPLPGVK
jgi:hypothetical protein